ncbi:hypothetical protein IWZ00DRAFT_485288 [Phyllosticta capitalensis]
MNNGLHQSYSSRPRSSGRPSASRSEQDLRANMGYSLRQTPSSLAVGQTQAPIGVYRGAPRVNQNGRTFAQRMRTAPLQDSTLDSTGGIPRSFSTTAQAQVAAVHQRRGIQQFKGQKPGLAPISESSEGVRDGRRDRLPAPRLPLLAFSGSGHLPMQGDAAAIIARKTQLLGELYRLESRGSVMNGVGSAREREILAELMDLVHEHPEADDMVGPAELPAFDGAFPEPAYARRPVWQQPEQVPMEELAELHASEPWDERPRRTSPSALAMVDDPEDTVYDVEWQSSRSFPANLSDFQVETLLRESMYEARRRQDDMAQDRALYEGNGKGPSASTSNTAIPSIHMIGPDEDESDNRMIDPRYNADLNETYLTPGGKMNARQRRRLAGIRPQIHDAPEVVTAEMFTDALPQIVVPPEHPQSQRALRYQQPPIEPDEAPLQRQASRPGLGARNSLKKTWKSFWNLK